MIDGGYRYDTQALARLIDAETKILYLANPTNPTGTWFGQAEFAELMAKVPQDVLVVYDSAYDEYATIDDLPRPLDYLKEGRRLLYLRTFSKAYGLAGVRVGFGIGPKDIIDGLMLARTSFTTNLLAQAGASARPWTTRNSWNARAPSTPPSWPSCAPDWPTCRSPSRPRRRISC